MASSPYVGEIRCFGFPFAPKGWALCNGQSLPINQNQALFAILGTYYGGNGQTTFNLPDLRGRTPMHFGSGGGGAYTLGQQGGSATVSLSNGQIPMHNHTANGSSQAPNTNTPSSTVLPGTVSSGTQYFTNNGPAVAMSPNVLSNTGGGQPHENRQPYQALNFCVCLNGIFPTRS